MPLARIEWLSAGLVERGIRVAAILLVAGGISWAVRSFATRMRTQLSTEQPQRPRRTQRADTLATVLTSVAIGATWSIACIYVLSLLGFSLAPLLAGVSIAGVAIGFGAQTLVRDFMSGFLILLEDQYGVGDRLEINQGIVGEVEEFSLRYTGLRDVDGSVHYVPNGTITKVTNHSKDWSKSLVDVKVPYDADLGKVCDAVEEAGRRSRASDPRVLGVEAVEQQTVVLRVAAQVVPGEREIAGRSLRARIKETFDERGLRVEVA